MSLSFPTPRSSDRTMGTADLATDCHLHVFGPAERFPFASERSYTPGDAPIDLLWRTLRTAGIGRAVLVKPSVYGRSEEYTSELQSLMSISYADLCLKKNKRHKTLA